MKSNAWGKRTGIRVILTVFIVALTLLFMEGNRMGYAAATNQDTGGKHARMHHRGNTRSTVFLEASAFISIKEFDWISFSCNGFDRQVQARRFRRTGPIFAIDLYEVVPCEGKVSGVSYWTSSGFVVDRVYPDVTREFFENSERVKARTVVKKNSSAHTSRSKKRGYSKSEIEVKICSVFGSDCRMAIAIAKAESGKDLNPEAEGDKHLSHYSYGLFQINRRYHDYPAYVLLDPDQNIKIAKKIFDDWKRKKGNGWLAWSTYKNGRYLAFLE